MTRWEYKVIPFKKRSFISGQLDAEALQEKLTNMGKQGWELVATQQSSINAFNPGSMLILKRPA